MDKISSALSFQSNALQLRSKKHEVIAGNIANAETPNYKAVDFDFAKTLQTVQSKGIDSKDGMIKTNPKHLSGKSTGLVESSMKFRPSVKGSLDGNTVDMEVERAAFTENAVKYEASAKSLTGTIRSMMTAINGQ